MKYYELDTPSLLIDRRILNDNLDKMQRYADSRNVLLRPHIKTHKSTEIAKMQLQKGASGIAVAKVGEAEVMAAAGIKDIAIANEPVGEIKLRRIAELCRADDMKLTFGIDSIYHIEAAEKVFSEYGLTANVMIEIEVGEMRSGINSENELFELLDYLRRTPHVLLKGIFGHDGNTYGASDLKECFEISIGAQKKLVSFAELAEQSGFDDLIVSYGSTPPLLAGVDIVPGITEIRLGTYALMDVSQGNAQGTLNMCAATVLATVISKPVRGRVILDAGAKALTMQERTVGICSSFGKGNIKGFDGTKIARMFDEHAIVNDENFFDAVKVGDKVRIIPVHICPVCNLYDEAFLLDGDEVTGTLNIEARGRIK